MKARVLIPLLFLLGLLLPLSDAADDPPIMATTSLPRQRPKVPDAGAELESRRAVLTPELGPYKTLRLAPKSREPLSPTRFSALSTPALSSVGSPRSEEPVRRRVPLPLSSAASHRRPTSTADARGSTVSHPSVSNLVSSEPNLPYKFQPSPLHTVEPSFSPSFSRYSPLNWLSRSRSSSGGRSSSSVRSLPQTLKTAMKSREAASVKDRASSARSISGGGYQGRTAASLASTETRSIERGSKGGNGRGSRRSAKALAVHDWVQPASVARGEKVGREEETVAKGVVEVARGMGRLRG